MLFLSEAQDFQNPNFQFRSLERLQHWLQVGPKMTKSKKRAPKAFYRAIFTKNDKSTGSAADNPKIHRILTKKRLRLKVKIHETEHFPDGRTDERRNPGSRSGPPYTRPGGNMRRSEEGVAPPTSLQCTCSLCLCYTEDVLVKTPPLQAARKK